MAHLSLNRLVINGGAGEFGLFWAFRGGILTCHLTGEALACHLTGELHQTNVASVVKHFVALILTMQIGSSAADGQPTPANSLPARIDSTSVRQQDSTMLRTPTAAEGTPAQIFESYATSFTISEATYVPSIDLSGRLGAYVPEISLPLTILVKDKSSTVYVSWSTFWTFSIALIGEAFAGDLLGATWLQMGIRYALLVPALAFNTFHHLVIIGPDGLSESTDMQLSTFVGWRTDLFGRAADSLSLVRWAPMAGIQVGWFDNQQQSSMSFALRLGVESPIDYESGLQPQHRRLRVFMGVRWYYYPRGPRQSR